jgi:hypothetical protein
MAVRPPPLWPLDIRVILSAAMQKLHRHHHAEPVELAEGWIGICATCGWVSRDYGSEEQARSESAGHVANAGECLQHSFRRHPQRALQARRGRGACRG